MNNLLEVKVEDLEEYVTAYIENKEPLMIWGAFGIGKSAVMREVAKLQAEKRGLIFTEDWDKINVEGYFVLVDMRLSQLDPSDTKGIPDLDRATQSSVWYIPKWFPKLGNGIIFFDEVNLATEAVQNTCYQIINDRELAGNKLPEGYNVIMAGNRGKEDGARVTKMQVPLLTRMGHIVISENYKGWLDWAEKSGRVSYDIILYLRQHLENIWRYETGTDGRDALCPRLWSKASKFLEGDFPRNIKRGLIMSVLNKSIATELFKFIELKDKYDIDKIIEGTNKMPDKIDEIYSVISGILGKVKDNPEILKKVLMIDIQEEEFKLVMLKSLKILMSNMDKNDEFKKLILTDINGYKKLLLSMVA